MIIARWQIDAKFGHKQKVLEAVEYWEREIASQLGWEKTRISTGSVGARESTVVTEVVLENLTELDESWDKLSEIDAHKEWGKELEPYIVNGSNRWEVFRVVD